MGIKNLPIIVYSHSSYSDVWPLIFGQIKKFHTTNPLYLFTNEKSYNGVTSIYYDESLNYNNRVIQCLSQINDKTFLFLHEDMPLYKTPNYSILDEYVKLIINGDLDSIKLIFAGNEVNPIPGKITPQYSYKNLTTTDCSHFSIQPTLIKKDTLLDILERYPSDDLWELESKIHISNYHPYIEQCTSLKGKQRGIHHFDSLVYPYIATAIVKGKWNFQEYPELKGLLDIYNIKSRNYND